MGVSKKERQMIIKKIILDEPVVKSQDHLLFLLKKNHNISVGQSTISKDLDDIGARSDRRLGKIVFDSDILKNAEKERLISLLERSEMEVLGDDLSSILIKVHEKYAYLVANDLVNFFSLIEIPVYVFPGIGGVIQILSPRIYIKDVENHIKSLHTKTNKTN